MKELRLDVDMQDELWQIQLENSEEHATTSFSETDLYKAMQALREYLEARRCQLLRAGTRPEVVPSAMSRSMGGGRQACVVRLGSQATEWVDTFDYAEPALVGTVQQQQEYVEAWCASLRA